ncbi:MAG: aminomethyl-transferring glycine dehydrogenase subunit GcvPA [Candidatus Obscuribacterales bacterium]|nr:aminomethyl-transferring glycine dehydrogenase subunit GcvPA [Candidatus Obscuribacterales bacterium]
MSQNTKKNLFPYLPHTSQDRQEMLKSIGVKTFEELVAHIPTEIRIKELNLPSGLTELELTEKISALAEKNVPASKQMSFLGGGSYRRFVPAAVSSILSRSEFATAYTPYQPEVSQGTLQAIYEFQTAICLLTDMDVANASIYDGPTACAEAALMSSRLTGRNKFLLSDSVNPEYKMVTQTYVETCGLSLSTVPNKEGITAIDELAIDDQTACLIVQYPNYFGCLEDLQALADTVHKAGALLVVVTDPISLGLLTAPGSTGADIVVGDAQQCGNNLSFGGPSAGFMASKNEFVRQMPGRLVGMTVDNRNQTAFTLTLQTREQHIRRAKATSNICTNQSLNALAMLLYLAMLGPQGLKEVADISLRRAHKLADLLAQIPGVKLKFKQPFFNEFIIETELPAAKLLTALQAEGVLGGLELTRFYPDMPNAILVAVTEMNSVNDLERYADTLKTCLANRLGEPKSAASKMTAGRC